MDGYSVSVAGVSHRQAVIAKLNPGERVTLVREPSNPHDPDAVAVHSPRVGKIGYVPRDSWLTGVIVDREKAVKAKVRAINPPTSTNPNMTVIIAVEIL